MDAGISPAVGPVIGNKSHAQNIKLSALLALAALAGCASIPTGPSMMALPGSGRSFDQFRYDDYACRQFASDQTGGTTPNQASITSGAGSAAVGAGLGAAAGAALGGGRGAAIGAGTGLLAGGLAGTGTARASGNEPAAVRYGLYTMHVCQRSSCSGIRSIHRRLTHERR